MLEDKAEETRVPCIDVDVDAGRLVIPGFEKVVVSGSSAAVYPVVKDTSSSSSTPLRRPAFVAIKLDDHSDVFSASSPTPSSVNINKPVSVSVPGRFSLNTLLNQFPNPPGNVPVQEWS